MIARAVHVNENSGDFQRATNNLRNRWIKIFRRKTNYEIIRADLSDIDQNGQMQRRIVMPVAIVNAVVQRIN